MQKTNTKFPRTIRVTKKVDLPRFESNEIIRGVLPKFTLFEFSNAWKKTN